MEQGIRHYINNKCVCLAQRHPHLIPYAALRTITSTRPMKIVGIDFKQFERCTGGYD